MNTYTLLFYRAFNNPTATILDQLIATIDGGQFSHVEIIESSDNMNEVRTIGCHAVRGGVTRGYYDLKKSACEIIVIESDADPFGYFNRTFGQPYSYVGAARTRWNWLPETKGHCCSSWLARAFQLLQPEFYGVEDLRQWALKKQIHK